MNSDLINELNFLREIGFTHLDMPQRQMQALESAEAGDADEFEQLRAEAMSCTKC